MRRGPALAALSGIAALAMPAHAQLAPTARKALPVTANAPQVCVMDRVRLDGGALVNFIGLDGDTLQIEQLTDSATLAARPASADLSVAAVCNFPHRIRLESQNNGLWPTDGRAASASRGFATALPYSARIDWGGTGASFVADAKVRRLTEARFSVDSPVAGDLRLRIAIEPGASNGGVAAPVLAGVYGDTLRIFLEPR